MWLSWIWFHDSAVLISRLLVKLRGWVWTLSQSYIWLFHVLGFFCFPWEQRGWLALVLIPTNLHLLMLSKRTFKDIDTIWSECRSARKIKRALPCYILPDNTLRRTAACLVAARQSYGQQRRRSWKLPRFSTRKRVTSSGTPVDQPYESHQFSIGGCFHLRSLSTP